MASAKFLIFASVSLCISAINSNAASDGPAREQVVCGGFVTSCRAPFDHNDGFLQGTCRADSGRWVVTFLNLNTHISNVNGNMVDGSGYEKTCEGYGIIRSSSDFIVTASCKKFDGAFRNTGYDVNDRISNRNGQLVFDNNC